MSIYFITGNEGKLTEAYAIIPQIQGLDLDLPEIQEIDAQKIIEAKLKEARAQQDGELVVEDTSLYLDGLNGLPGPLIKWFLNTIGDTGLYRLSGSLGSSRASAKTVIGYSKNLEDIHFFEGEVNGTIVEPKGSNGFGFDTVFQPEGYSKTFAEMGTEEKNKISMRKIAFSKIAEYLRT